MSEAHDRSEVHSKEADFHDAWAADTDVRTVRVREAFESATALENRFILKEIARKGGLRGKSILDIGAGLGESSVFFAMQGADVTTTDISEGMVRFAERLAEHHGVRVHGVVSTAEFLHLPEDHFDFVYIANTVHHVTDREALRRNVMRVLKPGGWFYAWDPLAYNPVINIYRNMASKVRTDDESPLRSRDIADFSKGFHSCGHREFWISALALFLKYFLVDRLHPNADRYWKRIYRESESALWWWKPLRALDDILSQIPLLRWLAWNSVYWGQKPKSDGSV